MKPPCLGIVTKTIKQILYALFTILGKLYSRILRTKTYFMLLARFSPPSNPHHSIADFSVFGDPIFKKNEANRMNKMYLEG